MDRGLRGRVAIVAAASKGLGRAVAEELAHAGARVAICARTTATLRETAAQIQNQAVAKCFIKPSILLILRQLRLLRPPSKPVSDALIFVLNQFWWPSVQLL